MAQAQLQLLNGAPVQPVLNVGDFMVHPQHPNIVCQQPVQVPIAPAPVFPGPYVRYF
jgi:hypothetical protein